MSKFYVYEIIDPKTNLPFYVGKGSGKRYLHHIADSKREKPYDTNMHKINKIRKILNEGLEPVINIIFRTEDEMEALNYESELIKKYGRIVDDTGILTNLRDSDSNLSGYTYKSKRNYLAENNPFYGKSHSEETKKKLRDKLSGKNSPRYGKTNSEKQKNAAREGFKKYMKDRKGSQISTSKLNESQVREIKIRLNNGDKPGELVKEFKISKSVISSIKVGRTWKHVTI